MKMIISGGQTGVDMAGLDVGRECGYEIGGYMPWGRRNELGEIGEEYGLEEMEEGCGYAERTAQNIRKSDGTLVLLEGRATGGTALTIRLCKELGKKLMIVNLNYSSLEDVREWLKGIEVLNIAGPRESKNPGIYERASKYLGELLRK